MLINGGGDVVTTKSTFPNMMLLKNDVIPNNILFKNLFKLLPFICLVLYEYTILYFLSTLASPFFLLCELVNIITSFSLSAKYVANESILLVQGPPLFYIEFMSMK